MRDREKYWAAVERQQREREARTAVPVPYRITQALDLHALYGPEVDRALGGEEPMVDLWEEGKLVPTREQIEALARLTDFPVSYFYMPVTESGGWGHACKRGGKGKGCERVWVGPPAPEAEVIPLTVAEPATPQAPACPHQEQLW